MNDLKQSLIKEIQKRVAEKILEPTNAQLLTKLITNADSNDEAINIATLGTTYKRTGLHFDKRLEKMSDTIRYFKKNEELSFHTDDSKPVNKLIIGDNYEALQNLLIQYKNAVDVIYIDPPYGKDSMGQFAETNYTNAITRDNLLSMLYPRLILAKQLLTDEGVIFCSIDDKNQAYVKCLFDEVFGEENFICNFIVNSAPAGQQSAEYVAIQQSYCLMYRKSVNFEIRNIELSEAEINEKYKDGKENGVRYYIERIWKRGIGGRKEDVPSLHFPVWYDEKSKKIYIDTEADNLNKENLIKIIPYQTKGVLGRWTWARETMISNRKSLVVKITSGEYKLYKKVWETEENGSRIKSIIDSDVSRTELGSLEIKSIMNGKEFDYPKPPLLMKILIQLHPNPNAIVLDFFAGSGTTGQSVLMANKADNGNRKFILCTNNEKTDANPNGIAYDVTSKRLKRIMTGSCYDGSKDFPWLKDNESYNANLDVYEIEHISNLATPQQNPFEAIDETLYGKEKFKTIKEKIDWVCQNFEKTQKELSRHAELDSASE